MLAVPTAQICRALTHAYSLEAVERRMFAKISSIGSLFRGARRPARHGSGPRFFPSRAVAAAQPPTPAATRPRVSSSRCALSVAPCLFLCLLPYLLLSYRLCVLTSGLLPSFEFEVISPALFFLPDTLTASAVSPPVETTPATTSPTVAKQNGHILHLHQPAGCRSKICSLLG
jgi:hypothetical protein